MTAHPSTASVASQLSESEREVLGQILTAAAAHDRECIATMEALRSARATGARIISLEELVDRAVFALTDVHAALAPIAIEHVVILAAAKAGDAGELLDLDDDAAERVLRPMFEAAGIPDRYVTGHR